MIEENKNLFLDINTLVFKYKEVNLFDFIKLINSTKLEQNHTLPLLYFLILKNNVSFWSIVKDKLEFNISNGNYVIQIHVLKNFKELDSIFSQNLENSLLISGLNFNLPNIKQIFFDFSILFNYSHNILFLERETDVSSVLWGQSPIEKYHFLVKSLTYKQKKQIFNSCIQYFRVSSVFILNELFLVKPRLFSSKILLNYISIFSQCNNNVQSHMLNFLLNTNKSNSFKIGVNLSYSHFNYDFLIDFFEQFSQLNYDNFSIMACGFISNPQQLRADVCLYLIRKLAFIDMNLKIQKKSFYKDKVKKI